MRMHERYSVHTRISGKCVIKRHCLRTSLGLVHTKITGMHTIKKRWFRGLLSHFEYKVTHTKDKWAHARGIVCIRI